MSQPLSETTSESSPETSSEASPEKSSAEQPKRWRRLPGSVWGLGFGSLFMDSSSELIHSLLPLFLVTTLHASVASVGVIEGIAEATAAIVKVFSGSLSDYLGRRKPVLVAGYALAALTKPIFPLASSVGWVFAARFIDRVGKGIRGAPRDALVAEVTPTELRGAASGLRQALDSVGALIGPLLALLLMLWLAGDLRQAMWFAVIPAVITVVLLLVYVREPERPLAPESGKRTLRFRSAAHLPRRYWLVLLLGAVFALARFSEAFLLLRAEDVGLAISYVPIVMVLMNLFYAVGAYPAGALSDRASPYTILLVGLLVLVVADLVLAQAAGVTLVLLGSALWGVHMALTQGIISRLVADSAPSDMLGTAFGLFNLVSGVALLLASVIAGALWSGYGAGITFYVGALFAALAAIGLLALWRVTA